MHMAGRRRVGAGRPAPREGGVRRGQRGVPCRSPRFGGPGRQEGGHRLRRRPAAGSSAPGGGASAAPGAATSGGVPMSRCVVIEG